MRTVSVWIVGIFIFLVGFVGSQIVMTALDFSPAQLGALGGTAFVVIRVWALVWIAKTVARKTARPKVDAETGREDA